MANHILGQNLIDALVRARVIDDPHRVRRVVIDIVANQPTKVYIERFGEDHRLVNVIESVGIEIRQGGQ